MSAISIAVIIELKCEKKTLSRGLVYREKKIGPSSEPCGAPVKSLCGAEVTMIQLLYYAQIQLY